MRAGTAVNTMPTDTPSGLVAVASASAGTEGTFFQPQFWKTAFGRQAAFAVLGLVVMLLALLLSKPSLML